MEVVVAIMLLIVPVISIAALLLSVRAYIRVKALKQLTIELSNLVRNPQPVAQKPQFVDKAISNYQMQVL